MTSETRICKDCGIPKPLDSTNFPERRRKNGAFYLRAKCRTCTRKASVASAARSAQDAPPKPPPQSGKSCKICEGMSWRVPGIKCPGEGCGRRYAPEPPVELVFRRTYERIA